MAYGWIYCGHANEVPRTCPCPEGCICRIEGCCKPRRQRMIEDVRRLVRELNATPAAGPWECTYVTITETPYTPPPPPKPRATNCGGCGAPDRSGGAFCGYCGARWEG
jgi:hypothetical protein